MVTEARFEPEFRSPIIRPLSQRVRKATTGPRHIRMSRSQPAVVTCCRPSAPMRPGETVTIRPLRRNELLEAQMTLAERGE